MARPWQGFGLDLGWTCGTGVARVSELPDGADRLVAVETKTGTNANGPWTVWKLRTANGVQAATFDDKLGAIAEEYHKRGDLCVLRTSQGQRGLVLDSISLFLPPNTVPPNTVPPTKAPERAAAKDAPKRLVTVTETPSAARVAAVEGRSVVVVECASGQSYIDPKAERCKNYAINCPSDFEAARPMRIVYYESAKGNRVIQAAETVEVEPVAAKPSETTDDFLM